MVLGIYGAGGLGREVLEIAKMVNDWTKRWEKIVFVVDQPDAEELSGCPVVSYERAKEEYQDSLEVSVGIGEPLTRYRIFEKLERDRVELANVIHPDTYIPETTRIGRGVTIQYGCFISCNASIGDYVYIQPQVNIGHDDVLGNGTMLSSSCNLAGNVHVGAFSYLGLSACVREGVSIGQWSIVGMASAVLKDIPDEVIAMGNPARPVRRNEERRVFR